MSNVCLIICFYAGTREGNQQINYKEYLSTQKKALKQFKHNLSRIVFVISQDGREEDEVLDIDGITYFYRRNRNLSFGGWVDAAKKFDHDYYIFSEDDYIICKDNFDKIMLDQYNKKNCTYLINWHGGATGLLSTIGMISSKFMYKLNNYNVENNEKYQAMVKFLLALVEAEVESLDFYDGFIYWEHRQQASFYYKGFDETKWGFMEKEVNIDDIDFAKVFVCCYQFYINNEKLFTK